MLVFNRKVGESFVLFDDQGIEVAKVYIASNSHGQIKIGVKAPQTTKVMRSELLTHEDKPTHG